MLRYLKFRLSRPLLWVPVIGGGSMYSGILYDQGQNPLGWIPYLYLRGLNWTLDQLNKNPIERMNFYSLLFHASQSTALTCPSLQLKLYEHFNTYVRLLQFSPFSKTLSETKLPFSKHQTFVEYFFPLFQDLDLAMAPSQSGIVPFGPPLKIYGSGLQFLEILLKDSTCLELLQQPPYNHSQHTWGGKYVDFIFQWISTIFLTFQNSKPKSFLSMPNYPASNHLSSSEFDTPSIHPLQSEIEAEYFALTFLYTSLLTTYRILQIMKSTSQNHGSIVTASRIEMLSQTRSKALNLIKQTNYAAAVPNAPPSHSNNSSTTFSISVEPDQSKSSSIINQFLFSWSSLKDKQHDSATLHVLTEWTSVAKRIILMLLEPAGRSQLYAESIQGIHNKFLNFNHNLLKKLRKRIEQQIGFQSSPILEISESTLQTLFRGTPLQHAAAQADEKFANTYLNPLHAYSQLITYWSNLQNLPKWSRKVEFLLWEKPLFVQLKEDSESQDLPVQLYGLLQECSELQQACKLMINELNWADSNIQFSSQRRLRPILNSAVKTPATLRCFGLSFREKFHYFSEWMVPIYNTALPVALLLWILYEDGWSFPNWQNLFTWTSLSVVPKNELAILQSRLDSPNLLKSTLPQPIGAAFYENKPNLLLSNLPLDSHRMHNMQKSNFGACNIAQYSYRNDSAGWKPRPLSGQDFAFNLLEQSGDTQTPRYPPLSPDSPLYNLFRTSSYMDRDAQCKNKG